jgi:hypothetical protein
MLPQERAQLQICVHRLGLKEEGARTCVDIHAKGRKKAVIEWRSGCAVLKEF